MEILLLSDVPCVGKKDDLLIVGNGFALNHLLPARKALVVTPNVRRRYAEKIKQRALEREREKTAMTETGKLLKGKTLLVSTSASKIGTLYGSVTEKDIAGALKAQFGVAVNAESVKLKESIKTLGMHTADLMSGIDSLPLQIEVKVQEETKAKKKAA